MFRKVEQLLVAHGRVFVNDTVLPSMWIPTLLRSSRYFADPGLLVLRLLSHVFLLSRRV